VAFDGLVRVPGSSRLGDYHYAPVLFAEGRRVRKTHRALLDVFALLLARFQGRRPAGGVVWHGDECRATRVRLTADPHTADRILDEIGRMRAEEAPPRLVLNDHCAACEFRQRCHEQAAKEDNISLLRGMKEKEVKAYARKGILTVTQLAHTFRPRRRRRRSKNRGPVHNPALQALAIATGRRTCSAPRNCPTPPSGCTSTLKASRTSGSSTSSG
jgi:predicted RecB family nuclease